MRPHRRRRRHRRQCRIRRLGRGATAGGGGDAMPKYYLTTAIDYSNGDPHLGHALEKVGADCIARYRRSRGDSVHFVMGMDEHSQSVVAAAAAAGVTPQAWGDRMADTFARYWRELGCSQDDWIRTTEPRHARAVTALLERIQERRPDIGRAAC